MKTGTEKILKDKIDSLGTLSGGIVFGKEEAWDKLQTRMDAPAKRVALLPWFSAAAVLLVLITIFAVYNSTTSNLSISKNKIETSTKANIPSVATASEMPEGNQTKNSVVPAQPLPQQPIAKKTEKQIPPVEPKVEITNEVVAETIPENLPVAPKTTAITEPVHPSKIPTKVVHVSELGNPAKEPPQQTFNNNTASVDVKKIPVVHLNDLTKQKDLINQFEGRMKDNIAVSIPLFSPAARYSNPDVYNPEYNTSRNFLKIKIN